MARGEKSFDLSTLFSLCNKFSVSISNFVIKEDYDFSLTEKCLDKPLIIFCDKNHMELFEINISYKFTAEREILFGNCIHLFNGMNVLIVPMEDNYLHKANLFLMNLNHDEKVSIFRLFGKSSRLVNKILEENKIDASNCKIVENDLLCDIYLSESSEVVGVSENQQTIGQLFFNDIYSQSELSLVEVATNLLKMQNLKLDIIEPFTCGEIAKEFALDSSVLYEALIPINNRAFVAEGQMTGFDFQNNGNCSVESNMFLCKSRLKQNCADIVLVLTAKEADGGYHEILSIADKMGVNTIKTFYKGKRKDVINFSVNWALYNLVKKLTKKDFENK